MLATAIGVEFREVADRAWDGKPAKAVVAARVYDTGADDLWDAVTNPERIPRWFAPVSGELKRGGRYQIEGNAGGTIRRCDAPQALDITWEFAGATSWVTLRLAPEARGTRLTLEHIVLAEDIKGEHWRTFGPGAVGVGWDLSFLGLARHLEGHAKPPEAWAASEEGKAFMRRSGEAWAEAHIASGEDPATARGMAQRAIAFYTGG